jgi:hypothetical protein
MTAHPGRVNPGDMTTSTATPTRKDDYDEYVLPDQHAGVSGKLCAWVVVVQRTPENTLANPELSEQAPMDGIITAHGRWVRPR